MEKQLLENAKEFKESGEDNFTKNRYNVAASDFFKAIVIVCDYLIYAKIRLLPKNHSERFLLLKIHYPEIEQKVSKLFSLYTNSYNLQVKEKDAKTLKTFADEMMKYAK